MASKYCSDFRRMAIADDSGRARSFSETSAVTLTSTTAGHAPALQQGHQQDAGRRQVEDVLRAAVRRAAHLHDLQGAEEVAAAFQVARHDHAVREGLFDPPLGIPFLGRTDLGHEQGRAPFRAQHGTEAEQEVPDPLLLPDPVAHRSRSPSACSFVGIDSGVPTRCALFEVNALSIRSENRGRPGGELSRSASARRPSQPWTTRKAWSQRPSLWPTRTQRGTVASSHRAPSIPPTSMAPGHPNSFRIPTTFFFAASSPPRTSIS